MLELSVLHINGQLSLKKKKKKALANVKVVFSIKPEQLGNVFLSLSSVEKFTQLST